MPLHDLGYRHWTGTLVPRARVWWAVADTGVKLAFKSRWFRRLLFAAWLPALYLGAGLYIFEQSVEQAGWRELAQGFLRGLVERDNRAFLPALALSQGIEGLAEQRHRIWTLILYTFFRYPQAYVVVVLIGMLAPPLIAQDLRSRAFLIYFSRPLYVLEYLFGKAYIVIRYLLLSSAIPALCLYAVGVLVSKDPTSIQHTWDIPLRILGATLVLVIPTTALALALSSLFTEVRYGIFAWFGIWIVGWVIYANLAFAHLAHGRRGVIPTWPTLFSLHHVLGNVQDWIFGMGKDHSMVVPSAILLGIITVVSSLVVYRRVTQPIRA